MDWILENPREGIIEAFVNHSFGGKYFLYVRFGWSTSLKPLDNYLFPSDSAAKRYYSTHYQSIKSGYEKPKWKKDIREIINEK
jgi:hypothetical protein